MHCKFRIALPPSLPSNGERKRSTVTLNYSVAQTEAAAKPENKSKWDQWPKLFKASLRSQALLWRPDKLASKTESWHCSATQKLSILGTCRMPNSPFAILLSQETRRPPGGSASHDRVGGRGREYKFQSCKLATFAQNVQYQAKKPYLEPALTSGRSTFEKLANSGLVID